MLKTLVFLLLLAAFAAHPVGRGAENLGDLPEISVRFYNYAGAAGGLLEQAQHQATRILLEAGVRLRWLSCTVSEGVVEDPRCDQLEGRAVLSLLVCPGHMVPKQGLPPGIFGFSLMPEHGHATSARGSISTGSKS